MADDKTIASRLRRLIVDALHLPGIAPDEIADDEPLFGEGLGLDSIDALELAVAMEKEFGIRVRNHEVEREAFTSVRTLVAFVERRLAAASPLQETEPPAGQPRPPARGPDA